MSKTVRHSTESAPKAANKQKVPTPYPPVEPTVAQRQPHQKDR